MTSNFISKIFYTIIGILEIIKQGNYFSIKQFDKVPKNRTLRILGNGKSLNEVQLSDKENIDYLVVNRHVLSDNYLEIKPGAYVLADPHFFSHPEGLNILEQINKRTSWPLKLYFPYYRGLIKKINNIITNPLITIIQYNCHPIQGYSTFLNFCYNYQLSMPVVQNVLVASIMIGILRDYKRIELYGVEHTWTKYLFVDEHNIVYLENPHFFDKEKVEAKALKEIQHTNNYPFFLILKNYSRMFESYWDIKNYLKDTRKNNKIINCTKGSFIDAFDRN